MYEVLSRFDYPKIHVDINSIVLLLIRQLYRYYFLISEILLQKRS